MKKIIIIILFILVVAGAGIFLWQRGSLWQATNPEPVMCTMEAKLCPDGSYVGRSGPKCEFAKCPVTTSGNFTKGELTLGVGESKKIDDLTIKINKVLEDSRCPSDVQCIQAGTVRLETLLTLPDSTESAVFSLNAKQQLYGSYLISLIAVLPGKISTKTITNKDYAVTFLVEKQKQNPTSQTGKISGKVTLSPTCPVEKFPPDPACAPKPYQTTIQAFLPDGSELVASAKSNADGTFTMSLPGGDYNLETKGGEVYPRCASQGVTVNAGKEVSVSISCDTGIR
ncbi:MAG: carboxypeptidase-like regulatory domain-containing protein [Patescibacteria group bacterium]